MVLHEDVGVGEFQHTLDRRHEARHLELLTLLGGGEPFPDSEPMLLDRCGEAMPLALRKSFEDCILQRVVEPAVNRDLDRSGIGIGPGLVHRHAVALDLFQPGRELGRRDDHVPERGRGFMVRSEEIVRAAELLLHRLDVVARLVLLESHGHQLVRERLRRRTERRFGHEGIRLVEVGDLPPRGVGHPEHAAEELLHVHGAPNAGDGAEDIGEGAIPSFLQRFDGDDVLDRARAIEEIDAVQLPLVAGGHRDFVRRDRGTTVRSRREFRSASCGSARCRRPLADRRGCRCRAGRRRGRRAGRVMRTPRFRSRDGRSR